MASPGALSAPQYLPWVSDFLIRHGGDLGKCENSPLAYSNLKFVLPQSVCCCSGFTDS